MVHRKRIFKNIYFKKTKKISNNVIKFVEKLVQNSK